MAQEAGRAVGRVHGNGDLPRIEVRETESGSYRITRALHWRFATTQGLTDARRDRGLRSIRRVGGETPGEVVIEEESIRRVGGETPVLIYPSPRRGDHRRLEQALRGTPGGVQARVPARAV